jgi:hypothetical protein
MKVPRSRWELARLPAWQIGGRQLPGAGLAWVAAGLALLTLAGSSCAAGEIRELSQETYWGESSDQLLSHFGAEATRLAHAIDFGDSYANVVLRDQRLGDVAVVVFFQMDKLTHGLKRIQLERPRHSVNPPAFRALLAALEEAYGAPDEDCSIPVLPSSGYQAATEALWVRNDTIVSAIFRDTTLQAFEGCFFGPATGYCGLTGQLLVRISPIDGDHDPDPCTLELHRNRPG